MKVMLTDICRPKQWKTIAVSDLNENGYWVYGANGIIGQYKNYNHEESVIMITCRGATCGEINISKPKSWINGNAMCLDNLSKQVMIKYLYYCLKAFNFKQIISGSAQPQITLMGLKKIIVEIIPLKAQAEIIQKLDFIEKLIYLKRQQLNKMDDLVKSRFIEMFGDPFINPKGWKKIKIQNAVTFEPQNGLYKPQSDYVSDGSGVPILRIDAFYQGVVSNLDKLKRLICNSHDRKKYLLMENDIVINRVNSIEYLGKCAHISGMKEETVFESNMMRMHFDEMRFDPIYVIQLLCSKFIYDQIIRHAKKAVNQASINQKDVLDFDIYQPPIALQRQFADLVQQADKSKVVSIRCLKWL